MLIPSWILFMLMYMMSFLIVLGSDDWFFVWLGLELNMMSFIILIFKQNSMMIVESCLKYFFIQSLSSAMFISVFYLSTKYMNMLNMFILSMKMGAGPFFFWFVSVCSGIEWYSCFFLMVFQKIIPLMLIVLFMSWVIWLIILISLMFGSFGSFNQSNMKRLMAYSSIHHLGWLLMLCLITNMTWMYYLLMYSIMLFSIIIVFDKNNIINMNNVIMYKNKMWMMFNMLNMSGIPPMIGFILKWMVFIYICNVNLFYIIFMILMSVLMFYVYIRIIYDILMLYSDEGCWMKYTMIKLYDEKIDMYNMLGVMGLMIVYLLI